MKRYLTHIGVLLLLASLFGCSKKNDTVIFDQTAEQRVTAALQKDQAVLTASPYGWKAVLFPGTGGGVGFLFKFDTKDGVQTFADDLVTDISPDFGSPSNSAYHMQALQRPSLLFDTYSYLHVLADPQAFNGEDGLGYSSDFEFSFIDASADSVKLLGNFNQSPMLLIKATQDEYNAYANGGLTKLSNLLDSYLLAAKGKKINLVIDGTHKAECTILKSRTDVPTGEPKERDQTFTISYVDSKGATQSQTTRWAKTINSLFLQEPLVYNGIVINEVFYDSAMKSLYIKSNGKRYELVVS